MSIRLMTAVWDLDLPPGEKLVLLALADQANDEGRQCWPAVSTIMKRSGQGERTVRRALHDLEAKGHLTRHYRDGGSTQYHVHPCQIGTPARSAPLPNPTGTPAKSAPKPSGTTIPKKDKPSSVKRASKARPTSVPLDFTPAPKPDSITAKAMADWPPGEVEEQVEHFVDHHTTKGTTSLDWQASWRTWVKNWRTFSGNRTGRLLARQPDLRGSRPEPALDLLRAARRAQEADSGPGDWRDRGQAGAALPALWTG